MLKNKRRKLNYENEELVKKSGGNTNRTSGIKTTNIQRAQTQHEVFKIMNMVQQGETLHKKYYKEMRTLYEKMDHEDFMLKFITVIKSAMEADEKNEFANISLLFCAKFPTIFECEDTHPLLDSIFNWLLSTISYNAHIRYRLCQFVNFLLCALGNEATLEDTICDRILTYMLACLRDINPNVRLQAILALQRLQVPDNPNDVVVKAYQYHLSSDPSPRVRQAVITAIGRNHNTIPYIIERLWDVDERVRRHTYLYMSSYPVKAYKVSQRLTFLEQGLNDRSEMVRKVVTTVLIPQWLESYKKNFISFVSAMKLDASSADIDRFRKITKVALKEMFKKQKIADLIGNLPLESCGDFERCVPFSKLSVEVTLYWLTLIEYLEDKDEIDYIVPELNVFCQYIIEYCNIIKSGNDNKWAKMDQQYVLLTLIEIIYKFDLHDEIGRVEMKKLLVVLLKNVEMNEKIIEVIVRCGEILMTNQEERLQFFVNIINDISQMITKSNEDSNDRILIEEFLESQQDQTLKLKYSSFKVKLLDLKEQEANFIKKKDYAQIDKISEELNRISEEYNNFLKSLTEGEFLSSLTLRETNDESSNNLIMALRRAERLTNDSIAKCLKISFFIVLSKDINSLMPCVNQLFQDFIRRFFESNSLSVREWALKCGTAYSMLYEQLAKDVFVILHSQFFKTNNSKIWKVTIDCMFELIDRYGFAKFEIENKVNNKTRKHTRQLYNTLEFLELEEETSSSNEYGGNVNVMFILSHFLDTCEDTSIVSSVVKGFSRLILHDHIENDDIMEKLLIIYFNPATDPETNQILGVFFTNLIKDKKQEYLLPCISPITLAILCASYDSPLREIKPETVLKFIIDSTRQEFCNPDKNLHNSIALLFLKEMQNNIANRELLRILSKELISLIISKTNDPSKNELNALCESILERDVDPTTVKNIINFKNLLGFTTNDNDNNRDDSKNDCENSDEVNNSGEGGTNQNIIATKSNETIEIQQQSDGKENNESNKTFTENHVVDKNNTDIVIAALTQSLQSRSKNVPIDDKNSDNFIVAISSSALLDLQSGCSKNIEENETSYYQEKEIGEDINEKKDEEKSNEEEKYKESSETNGEEKSKGRNNNEDNKNLEVIELKAKSKADYHDSTSDNAKTLPTPTTQITDITLAYAEDLNKPIYKTPKKNENNDIQKMPTTYGKDNTTNLRYLRKSLNINRRIETENNEIRIPKIRIEAKLESRTGRDKNSNKTQIINVSVEKNFLSPPSKTEMNSSIYQDKSQGREKLGEIRDDNKNMLLINVESNAKKQKPHEQHQAQKRIIDIYSSLRSKKNVEENKLPIIEIQNKRPSSSVGAENSANTMEKQGANKNMSLQQQQHQQLQQYKNVENERDASISRVRNKSTPQSSKSQSRNNLSLSSEEISSPILRRTRNHIFKSSIVNYKTSSTNNTTKIRSRIPVLERNSRIKTKNNDRYATRNFTDVTKKKKKINVEHSKINKQITSTNPTIMSKSKQQISKSVESKTPSISSSNENKKLSNNLNKINENHIGIRTRSRTRNELSNTSFTSLLSLQSKADQHQEELISKTIVTSNRSRSNLRNDALSNSTLLSSVNTIVDTSYLLKLHKRKQQSEITTPENKNKSPKNSVNTSKGSFNIASTRIDDNILSKSSNQEQQEQQKNVKTTKLKANKQEQLKKLTSQDSNYITTQKRLSVKRKNISPISSNEEISSNIIRFSKRKHNLRRKTK